MINIPNDSSNTSSENRNQLSIGQLIRKKHKLKKLSQVLPVSISPNRVITSANLLSTTKLGNTEQTVDVSPGIIKNFNSSQRSITLINKQNASQADEQISRNPVTTNKTIIQNNQICRLCLDSDTQEMPLIQPCKCLGKKQYIHDLCLKAEILSSANIRDAQCQECQYKYKMILKTKRECQPVILSLYKKLAWERSPNKPKLIAFTTLELFLITLALLIIIRIGEIQSKSLDNILDNYIFLIFALIFCIIMLSISTWFLYSMIHQIVFVDSIQEWLIMNFVIARKPVLRNQTLVKIIPCHYQRNQN